MAEYYAVERSTEYLAHYGVKGMRWGVRRALKRNDEKALARHRDRAYKKYEKLLNKADIPTVTNNASAHRAIGRLFGGFAGVQGGLSAALIAEQGAKGLPLAAFFTGPSAATAGIAGINYLKNKRRLTTAGHSKAVQKVKEWEKATKEAFKGTKYEPYFKDYNYDDSYEIRQLTKGHGGYREVPVAKISGAHLTSDYKGKDKDRFIKTALQAIDPISVSKKGVPSLNSRSLNRDSNISLKKLDTDDPMAFGYDYYTLHRKRGDKKIPIHRSSTEQYENYWYAKHRK